MSKVEIKQFKLVTGDEIICEVVEWDSEESSQIIIRSAMKLVESMSIKTGIRWFNFKPWLTFSDDPSLLQTLNSLHIVGETEPSKELLKMYAQCLKKLNTFLNKYNTSNKNTTYNLDAFDDMSDSELHDFLEKEMEKIVAIEKSLSVVGDSDSNVIPFRIKDDLLN